jgi:hypothetical protein
MQRLAERNILQIEVLKGLRTGKIIEEYPDDTPYPAALFLCTTKTKTLHIVAAYDGVNHWAYVITVYEPDSESFEPDFMTRRKK